MRRENNGTWMTAIFVCASLVNASVVAAGQQQAAPDAQAASQRSTGSTESMVAPLGGDSAHSILEVRATSFPNLCNNTCKSSYQCIRWCGDAAACVGDRIGTLKHCVRL